MAPNEPMLSNYGSEVNLSDFSNGANLAVPDTQNPPLDTLFDVKYLRKPMTKLQWLVFILYTPFGVVLAVARVFLVVLLCLFAIITEKISPGLISDKTLFHLIAIITAVFVRKVHGKLPTEEELAHSFVVSNHTMTGDPGVLHFLYHKNAKILHKVGLGGFDIICRHNILVGGDKAQAKKQILDSIEKDPTPVVIYPEGATTNGNVGILRFSSFIFGLDRNIIPVGVRYTAALPFVPFHSVLPYYTFHMFLVCYQPWVLVEAWVMRPESRQATETPEQFAERVQKQISNATGLISTTYTASDKTNYRKEAMANKKKQK